MEHNDELSAWEYLEDQMPLDMAYFLLEWFNTVFTYPLDESEYDDLDALIEMVQNGQVVYKRCPLCYNDGYEIDVHDWSRFQGVMDNNDVWHGMFVNIDGLEHEICEECYDNNVYLK
jgi:hypothetical protein